MFKVVKYIGADKDSEEWDETPFETQAEANKVAKDYSRKYKSLFTVEDEKKIYSYWWKGSNRSNHEIEVRRRNHQWT